MHDIGRLLNSVGKECFVKYFEEFRSTELSNSELAEIISNQENYILEATKTRVSSARKIITFNNAREALELIIDSKRLESDIVEDAKRIYNSLSKDKDMNDSNLNKYYQIDNCPEYSDRLYATIANQYIGKEVEVPASRKNRSAKYFIEYIHKIPRNIQQRLAVGNAKSWNNMVYLYNGFADELGYKKIASYDELGYLIGE